jgi:hypothetical protein
MGIISSLIKWEGIFSSLCSLSMIPLSGSLFRGLFSSHSDRSVTITSRHLRAYRRIMFSSSSCTFIINLCFPLLDNYQFYVNRRMLLDGGEFPTHFSRKENYNSLLADLVYFLRLSYLLISYLSNFDI